MILCPYLPVPETPVSALSARSLARQQRGAQFYELRLAYAQTKLMQNFPAQAILQLNRAFSSNLEENAEVLDRWPLPYAAMAWILDARPDRQGMFLGNPRRHWQHYATRMSGQLAELRIWRSWACWWLCEGRLPMREFPIDQKQIEDENIGLPGRDTVVEKLRHFGLRGEAEIWADLVIS